MKLFSILLFIFGYSSARATDCSIQESVYSYFSQEILNQKCCSSLEIYELALFNEKEKHKNLEGFSTKTMEEKKDILQAAIACVLKKVNLEDYQSFTSAIKDQKKTEEAAKLIRDEIVEKTTKNPLDADAILSPEKAQTVILETGLKLLNKKTKGMNEIRRFEAQKKLARQMYDDFNKQLNTEKEAQTKECRDAQGKHFYDKEKKKADSSGKTVGAMKDLLEADLARKATTHSSEGFRKIWATEKKNYSGQKRGLTPEIIRRVEYIRAKCLHETVRNPNPNVLMGDQAVKATLSKMEDQDSCITFVVDQLKNTSSATVNLSGTVCEDENKKMLAAMQATRQTISIETGTRTPTEEKEERLITEDEIKQKVSKFNDLTKKVDEQEKISEALDKKVSDIISRNKEALATDKECGFVEALEASNALEGAAVVSSSVEQQNKLKVIEKKLETLREICKDKEYCPECSTSGAPSRNGTSGSQIPSVNGDGNTIIINGEGSHGNSTNVNSGENAGSVNKNKVKTNVGSSPN